MPEIAINTPFESSEIIDIAKQEFEKRLRGLSPLHGGKEYAAFSLDFQVTIRLQRAGEIKGEARETLAWGKVVSSPPILVATPDQVESVEETSHFDSKDPNEERVARDMPLTVESGDGKGGRIKRKVRVKSA